MIMKHIYHLMSLSKKEIKDKRKMVIEYFKKAEEKEKK